MMFWTFGGKGSVTELIIGCKGYFPFATVIDGCEEVNFMVLSCEYGFLDKFHNILELIGKFNEIHLLATISNSCIGEIIYFATVSYGWKALIIYEIRLNFDKLRLIYDFGKKIANFIFPSSN